MQLVTRRTSRTVRCVNVVVVAPTVAAGERLHGCAGPSLW